MQTKNKLFPQSKIKMAIIITAFTLLVVVIIGIIVFDTLQQDRTRVFSGIGTSITLYEDGTFNAFLPHNMRKFGTYTEAIADGVTTVLFTSNGETVSGRISSNVLTLPSEWEPECFCWHNLRLRLI